MKKMVEKYYNIIYYCAYKLLFYFYIDLLILTIGWD